MQNDSNDDKILVFLYSIDFQLLHLDGLFIFIIFLATCVATHMLWARSRHIIQPKRC